VKLECGHDGEDGLVCAACLKEAGGLEAGYLEALDRLGLVRRLAGAWAARAGPLASYMARRVTAILDAPVERLAVMKSTKLVHEEEEPEDEDQTAASEDWADHMGRQPGGGAR
jgi:hypothetical protein